MNHQEMSPDVQETEFGGPSASKQRRVIYFASGETLEEEDSEEEEEQSEGRPPFREPADTPRFSFKNVAFLVGRISLLGGVSDSGESLLSNSLLVKICKYLLTIACDVLGERLAGALGLNAAKYQYAIDQYHRAHKTTSSQTAENGIEGQAETLHLSPRPDSSSHYGATEDVLRPADPQQSCDEKHMDRNVGCQNRAYQAEEDDLEER